MPEELEDRLRSLQARLQATTRQRWQRDLPFDELLFDRWERARSLGFGEGASIYQSSYVYGEVHVGPETWIGPFTLLDGSGGGLWIGEHCSISAGVQIYTHDTILRSLSGGAAAIDRAPVRIGDRTYIGAQTVVGKGVTVGDHVVVGANSFVNRDIPSYRIAVGSPCRVIGEVELRPDGQISLRYDGSDV